VRIVFLLSVCSEAVGEAWFPLALVGLVLPMVAVSPGSPLAGILCPPLLPVHGCVASCEKENRGLGIDSTGSRIAYTKVGLATDLDADHVQADDC
jgi:hypothetical protein